MKDFLGLKDLDWPKHSLRFVPIYLGYAAILGAMFGTTSQPVSYVYYLVGSFIAASGAGYLLPRDNDLFGRGPVAAQMANGVAAAIIAAVFLKFGMAV